MSSANNSSMRKSISWKPSNKEIHKICSDYMTFSRPKIIFISLLSFVKVRMLPNYSEKRKYWGMIVIT